MKNPLTYKLIQLLNFIFLIHQIHATEIRDNYFCDINNSRLSFKPANDKDWYSITDGQPFDKEVNNVRGRPNCLNIRAGRHNSTKNVKWVKDKLEILNVPWKEGFATATSYDFNYLPHSLNFALKGTLTYKSPAGLTAICNNVIIAEGYQWGYHTNNLWLFNNATDSLHSLKCFDPVNQQTIYIKAKGKNDDYGNEAFNLSTFY